MALTYPFRSYAGGAVAGTLSAALNSGDTTFHSSTSLAGWTDITGGSFTGQVVVAVEYGTANEEKILCTYASGTGIFTIITRNYDGTTYSIATPHASGKPFNIVFTATEAAELNDVTQTLKTMLLNTGTATVGANVGVDISPAAGSSGFPALADHSHNIPSTSLSSWLATTNTATTNVTVPAANIAAGTLGSTVVVPLTNLATGTLPASVSTSNIAWTGGGTTWTSGTAPIIGPITGYNDYIILCNASVRASSSGINIAVTVNQSASSTMSSPTAIVSNLTWGATATQSYCVTAVGAYSPGSSASFYVQPALTSATIYSVTLTVIGIN